MLPETVDILGVRYAVESEDAATSGAELYDKHGLVDDLQCRIRIPARGPEDRRAVTLLHEIIHAIDAATEDAEDQLREKDVVRLTRGLRTVMRANDGLARVVFGEV